MAAKKALDTEQEALGPTLDFMRTVWTLNHAFEVTSKLMESELGITAQQRMMVRIVGKYPGISAGRLAELLRVHRGTVSVALKRLEQRRIIKRERDDVDQRRVTLTLTKKGQALDVPACGTVESAVAHLLSTAHARDLVTAKKAIMSLVSALEQRK